MKEKQRSCTRSPEVKLVGQRSHRIKWNRAMAEKDEQPCQKGSIVELVIKALKLCGLALELT